MVNISRTAFPACPRHRSKASATRAPAQGLRPAKNATDSQHAGASLSHSSSKGTRASGVSVSPGLASVDGSGTPSVVIRSRECRAAWAGASSRHSPVRRRHKPWRESKGASVMKVPSSDMLEEPETVRRSRTYARMDCDSDRTASMAVESPPSSNFSITCTEDCVATGRNPEGSPLARTIANCFLILAWEDVGLLGLSSPSTTPEDKSASIIMNMKAKVASFSSTSSSWSSHAVCMLWVLTSCNNLFVSRALSLRALVSHV
mmetsp:Transcript_113441/g.196977  ORF Transcript_113441/g.196977 Transcript_113441/m.196977 type:complete len:261 (+) Transcript_113441:2787-3569(+)